MIEIPFEFVEIAGRWYNGMGDMLYAVSSTGGLTLGSIKPLDADSKEEWYYMLWCALAADVGAARRAAEGANFMDDYEVLCRFENWVDEQCDEIALEFDLK